MERKNKKGKKGNEEVVSTTNYVKIRWRKIGGGSLRWNNKIIKPGEIFEADEDKLPKAFMDTLICVNPEDRGKIQEAQKAEKQTKEILYKLQSDTEDENLWNIINEEGKPINEKPMVKEEADALLFSVNFC